MPRDPCSPAASCRPSRLFFPEQLFVPLGRVVMAASADSDEAEWLGCRSASPDDVPLDGVADQGGHRTAFPPRQRLELPFQLLVDEDGRSLHMTYDSIYLATRHNRYRGAPRVAIERCLSVLCTPVA
jgi:hypothetical protein